MTGHPQIQYRPPQPVPGQYPTPFSQQQQQPYGMSPQYQVAPPQQQFVIMRAPAGPMPQQQFQQQARQPEQPKLQPRKKTIIQIKDPTDNRDITDEIKSEHAVVEAIGEEGIVKTVSAFLRVTFCKRPEVTNRAKKFIPSYFATKTLLVSHY